VLAPRAIARWLLLGRCQSSELRELFKSALVQVKPSVLAARARAVAGVDAADELRACPVPILYLAASNDHVVGPGNLQLIQRLNPQVDAITLSGPHLLLQAAPVEASRAIAAFVERISAR
jgi:pimeloyl-ACP methyl ester carboxylesterase